MDNRQVHKLKTLPQYWDAIQRGDKTFDVRRDDRGFQRGDILELHRMKKGLLGGYEVELDFNSHEPKYIMLCEITYILTGGQFGIEPGHVVMGIKKSSTNRVP